MSDATKERVSRFIALALIYAGVLALERWLGWNATHILLLSVLSGLMKWSRK